MESDFQASTESEGNGMKTVECPVCARRYRFDVSKMTKQTMRVKCRKCENTFVISTDMFSSPGAEALSGSPPTAEPSPPTTEEEPSSPVTDDLRTRSLVIKSIPNETARLRIATRLMPLTREMLSPLIKRLSKPPAIFSFEMTPAEADNLLKTIQSMGAKAEFSTPDVSRIRARRGAEDPSERSWKRWIAAAVLIFFVVGGGGLSYHMYREVKKTETLEQRGIDSIIPAGAFFYVQFKYIEENWARIREDAKERNFGALFENLKSTRQVQDLLSRKKDLERKMGLPLIGPDLMDFLRSDVRAAFYARKGPEVIQFVLTMKGNLKIKLMDTLLKWIPQPLRGSLPRRVDDEQMIYTFRPEGLRREIYFFSHGLVYIVSSSPDLIRTSVSLAGGGIPARRSLKPISPLSERGKRTSATQIASFYVSLQKLMGVADKKRSKERPPFPAQLNGYGDLGGTISFGKGLVIESTLTVNPESLDQPIRALFECPPGENKTLRYVPKNAIIYASNNCLNLASYLPWIRENLKKRPDSSMALDSIIQGINAQTGMDIEKEILALLGKGFSYAVLAPNREGKLPLPGIQLFFELEDRPKMEASIGQLLGKPVIRSSLERAGLDLVNVNHEEIPITYLRYQGDDMRFFLLSAFEPCYAFVDDTLVIGSDLEGLKQMVDLSRGRGTSMLTDRRFSEVKPFVREKNNGMTYINLKATSRLLKGLTTQNPMGGFGEVQGQTLQDMQVFLEIMETLNYAFSTADFEGDRVRIVFYVAL
ncbi:MAG: DUF3352 domain-containing protein [Proteobacteria bacterium]|nr:DUF3352 domain-containing protein [Pseudomonadota bacterium]NIS69271.1 DUF3352 domain-containing protein [Pseudomonadota bacterium]